MMSYQYFIQVVPTEVQATSGFRYETCQYAVTDQERPIDHASNSHGNPGIFFKYDMSALRVRVAQDRESLPQFLVRLCAGVGGLCATSQLVCVLIKAGVEYYCCTKKSKKDSAAHAQVPQEARPLVPGPETGAVPKRPADTFEK